MSNRFEGCAKFLADFLNTNLFGPSGPHQGLKLFLVPEHHTGNVLKDFLTEGYKGRVCPISAKEANTLPLSQDTPPNLLLGMGCLRMFDMDSNGEDGHSPQCTFSPQPKQLLINGSLQLDRYGPIGFEIMYTIAGALGGEFEMIRNVVKDAQVDTAMDARITR